MPDRDRMEPEEYERTLAELLASLDALADRYSPADLVVLPRAEVERREFRAYASGWQDAEEALRRAAEEAGRSPAERFRPPPDTGPADILTFPLHRAGRAGPPGVPAPRTPDAAEPADGSGGEGPGGGRRPEARDAAGAERREPVFDLKPRRSRAPTIPRLPRRTPGRPPRRRKPDDAG
ncbi:hypothetical protein ACFSJS_02775 [Streptomyces desertarenae]|uniref:Translation initiation factor IF-2 n=1 Tax=Streptomyces desertarenae TaxID=2666184 RepID=A0ABW4PE53_9ACTN